MSTKISWAEKTWNVIIGCSKVSAGCANCYAERMALRLAGKGIEQYQEVTTCNEPGTNHWNGETAFVESALTKPLHWRTPRKIFVNSMGDTFHPSVPFEWIEKVMGIIEQCPQHTFCMLTKRPHIMAEYFNGLGKRYELSCCANLHLGVTVENQDNVGRIADLNWTRAVKKFLSIEPLLPGKLNIRDAMYRDQDGRKNKQWMVRCIDYVFIGCGSGYEEEKRLCTLDDIRYVMKQCRQAKVKIHIKQIPLKGKCNKNFDEWPPEFQVREV